MERFMSFRIVKAAVLVVVAGGVLIGLRSWAAPQDAAAPKAEVAGNAENGKKLFDTVGCWECHGFVGQGGAAGARIGRPALPLSAFLAYVRHPKGQMPPFEAKAISDSDLTDIYAYLQSVPKPPALKDIPLLNN